MILFNSTRYLKSFWFPVMALLFIHAISPAHAESNLSDTDRASIANEVRAELKKLLNEEGILDKAIERGIINYVKKQQASARKGKQAERSRNAQNVRPVSPDEDHLLGNPKASVSLIEYSDFECPFCKRFHPSARRLIENNNGKVNWVYRHFPLEFHNPGAQKQAEASECAAELGGNDAFWRYSDLIYARTKSNGKGFPIDNLVPLAQEIGLERESFKRCLEKGQMRARVLKDYQNGVQSGISGTPGNIFINNTTGEVIAAAGALPVEQLQSIVDRLLKKKDVR